MSEWQLIDTAPTDGTDVLAYSSVSDEQFVVFYEEGKWLIIKNVGVKQIDIVDLTHWMHLPKPPID